MPRQLSAPAVSIILATFDRRHLVKDAIASALAQRADDLELIVVDDGSRDGTERAVLPFARRDPRVIYVKRAANRGLAHARNLGLAVATGRWVAFLDDDDLYEPDHLSARLEYTADNPAVDGTWGGIIAVGPRASAWLSDLERPGKKIHASRCHLSGTLFLRRRALAAIGGFRDLPNEDYELCRRFEARFRLDRVEFKTYRYRVAGADRITRRGIAGDPGAVARRPIAAS